MTELNEVSKSIKNLGRDILYDKKDTKTSLKELKLSEFKFEDSMFSLYHKVKNSRIKKYKKIKRKVSIIKSKKFEEFEEFELR
jgi:hypothetical protein